MFKKFFLSLILLIFGTFFTNIYKNKSKILEEKIIEKKKNYLWIKKI